MCIEDAPLFDSCRETHRKIRRKLRGKKYTFSLKSLVFSLCIIEQFKILRRGIEGDTRSSWYHSITWDCYCVCVRSLWFIYKQSSSVYTRREIIQTIAFASVTYCLQTNYSYIGIFFTNIFQKELDGRL